AHRRGWRQARAGPGAPLFPFTTLFRARPRPGHRRPNVHWRSRKPILTPPMESKAEIVAMDGDGASRGGPMIALSHDRRLWGGLGRVTGGRMCTDGAENRF